MRWQSIDKQADLDALDRAVCWDDTDLLEIHGGRHAWTLSLADINRRGLDALDYRVLLRVCGAKEAPYLELAFVECDEFSQRAFLAGLGGRVTTLMQVEIGPVLQGIRCSRVFFRWLQEDEVGKPHHYTDHQGLFQ
jgi:hypothetical protein